ncbi:MAG: TetR/AcrR family transcriptional regulator [Candidatus Nanohaloarchaea archaeon]
MGRRKSREERREEVLEEGLKLLHEKGHAHITVGEIADRIGISEAAVYRHFDSKEDIIQGMAEKVFSIDLVDREKLEFDSPERLLNTLFEELFRKLEDNPEATAILFHDEVFSRYPKVEKLFRKHRNGKKSRLEELVRIGQEAGIFSEEVEPEVFATMVTGSIRATVMEWREENFSRPLTEESGKLAEHFARIIEK